MEGDHEIAGQLLNTDRILACVEASYGTDARDAFARLLTMPEHREKPAHQLIEIAWQETYGSQVENARMSLLLGFDDGSTSEGFPMAEESREGEPPQISVIW